MTNKMYPGVFRGSAPRARGGCSRGIGLGAAFITLAICGMAACVLLLFLPNLYDPQGGAVPRVRIRVPSPGAQVRARDGQAVVIQTYEAKGITRYELWVDGNLALFENPQAGASELPPVTEMMWRPSELGTRVLVARATDERGRVGVSQPVVVEVVEPPADELVCAPVEVQPGDTWETVAARYGVSPNQARQCNPGLTELPAPGGVVNAPIPRDQLPADFFGVDEPGDNAEPAGPAGPPVEPPQGEGAGPANEVEGGSAGNNLPWGFGAGFGAPDPPTAPAQLTLELTGGCGVRAHWSDNSINETGFRLYRSGAGADFRVIRDFGANEALAELTYDDTVPLGGHYEYYAAAVNDGGESPGPIAGIDVPNEACAIQIPPLVMGVATPLQFEALELTTSNDFDRVYCFLSLARLEPHSRIPRLEDSFLGHAGPGWNIADWAAGSLRYVFIQDSTQAVPVEINCWGTRLPDETYDLGTWMGSHPSEEWDGRDLFGETDGFRVRYRIEGFKNEPPLAHEIADWSIPRPTNVRQAANPLECADNVNKPGGHELSPGEGVIGQWACLEIWEQMLIWDWAPNEYTPREELTGFRVYINRATAGQQEVDPEGWEALGESGSVNQIIPIPTPSCDQVFHFRVKAFKSGFPEIVSNPSEPFSIYGPPCPNQALVEITLETIAVSDLDDGCLLFCDGENLQSYGWGWLNLYHADGDWDQGASVWFFQQHIQAGLGRGVINAYRHVYNGTLYLENEDLMMCGPCDDFGPGNNRIQLRFRDGDSLSFPFWLFDEDDIEDDIWCGTTEDSGIGDDINRDVFGNEKETKPFVIGPFTLDEWATMDRQFTWDNSGDALSDQDANCTFTIRIRGLGRVP